MRYMFLRFPEGKSKAVTFSYDDGCKEDIKLADIVTGYKMKCTFNLNGGSLHKERGITEDEVREHILGKGHEIAVHGILHRAEGYQRPIEGIKDVLDCRLELEERYGMIIRGMAYPDSGITRFGNTATYEKVKAYLKELDIAYSRTLGGDNGAFFLPNDWHAWMPSAHHKNPHIMELAESFLNIDLSNRVYCASRAPRLFYMWGHAYEYEHDKNWDLLEKICEILADKDEIWYATNIEIHDYVEAYNSLIYSASGKIIYNPTLFDIWFDVDGELKKIASGETIKL